MRERFWSIPAVLVLAGVLTAVVVCRPDLLGLPTDWDLGHVVRIRTADTMLQVMASSMLTFVGVVFAITLVGLQLASSQLSPRVIRTFVRSAITKTAFGVFLATFAFAVTGLAFDNVDDVAAASRTVGACVAMLSVAVIGVRRLRHRDHASAGGRLGDHERRQRGARVYPEGLSSRLQLRRTPSRRCCRATPHVVHLGATDTRGFKGVLGTVLGIDRASWSDWPARTTV